MAAIEKVTDIEISRTEKEEIKTNFDELRQYLVQDEAGNKVTFGDVYAKRKTIVVLTRHFLCFTAKEYVDDLAIIPKENLDKADVAIVVIGCAPHKFIKPFRRETGYRYLLYTDPERGLYKLLGCHGKLVVGKSRTSKHIKSGPITGVLKSTWRAIQFPGEWQGDPDQMGASFVIGPGDVIHFSHIDQNMTDHAPINELLEAAGAKLVNFEKDKLIQDV